MSNVLLDEQADAIDNVLNQYNIIGRCAGGTLTHRRLMFDVVLQPGTPLERIEALAPHFANVLGCDRVDVKKNNGGAIIAKDIADSRLLLSIILQQYTTRIPAYTAVLGLDDNDAPLLLRIPSADVQSTVAVGGKCKSLLKVMLESLIACNTPDDLQIIGYKTDSHKWTGDIQQEITRRVQKDVNHPVLIVAIPDLAKFSPVVAADILSRGAAVGVYILAASATEPQQKFGITLQATDNRGGYVLHHVSSEIPFIAATLSEASPEKRVKLTQAVQPVPDDMDTKGLFEEIEELLRGN